MTSRRAWIGMGGNGRPAPGWTRYSYGLAAEFRSAERARSPQHPASTEIDGNGILLGLGRIHLYEGHGSRAVVHAVRTAIAAGCRIVVLTNACGSMRPDWPIGGPVIISDQINFTGVSPMPGASPPQPWPDRFVPLVDLYSPRLRAMIHQVEPDLPEGSTSAFTVPNSRPRPKCEWPRPGEGTSWECLRSWRP